MKKTHKAIGLDRNFYGFTSKYLFLSADYEQFSSSAKTSTMIKLAKLDLQQGTTIPELVFSCCKWFPIKKAIKALIELGRQDKNEKEVIERVFEFQNYIGKNSLTTIFHMATMNTNENNAQYSSRSLLRHIEDSCLHLIKLAKSGNLDLEKTLNHTDKTGHTLFNYAAAFSEQVTERLLLEPTVRANSITDKFVIPFFSVRLKVFFFENNFSFSSTDKNKL